MTHTPGSYEITIGPGENDWAVCLQGAGDVIAEVFAHHEAPPGTAKDNAILFAAAPETAVERDRLKAINAELVTMLKTARDCVAYCRRAHPGIQAGTGVPIESFIDEILGRAESLGEEVKP